MQKAIFVFDAKDTIIVAKVHAGKVSDVTCIHMHVSLLRSDTRTRPGVLPKSGIRTSIMSVMPVWASPETKRD